MSTDLETAQAQVAFWKLVGPVLEEFEAAKDVKGEDPERWKAAVHAMDGEPDGLRFALRALAQAEPAAEGEIVTAAPVESKISVKEVK